MKTDRQTNVSLLDTIVSEAEICADEFISNEQKNMII